MARPVDISRLCRLITRPFGALAVARKLLKRSYHTLRELGEEALQLA